MAESGTVTIVRGEKITALKMAFRFALTEEDQHEARAKGVLNEKIVLAVMDITWGTAGRWQGESHSLQPLFPNYIQSWSREAYNLLRLKSESFFLGRKPCLSSRGTILS